MKHKIIHLLDDATPGGVTRVIDALRTSDALATLATHDLQMVPDRGRWPLFEADIIISHLAINWRTLPALMSLRAQHPNAELMHVEHSYTQRFTALHVSNKDRFYTLLRTAYALFDKVVCVSRAQGSWMATRALVNNEHLRIIRSAVDLARFTDVPALSGNPKTFGLIGRLHPQKGFDVAIQAFRDLQEPDVRLKIFGTGDERDALRALAGQDPRISFEGFCADPKDAMAQVDVVVMPSRWEAFGLVAQEALAAGRAVLVAPVDGLLDQINDGAVAMSGIGISSLTSDMRRFLTAESYKPIANRKSFAGASRKRFEDDWSRLINEVRAPEVAAA